MVTGLVLTGGGARGAYQVGALLALSDITGKRRLPFDVLSGASAGSLSASYLVACADDFRSATRALADLWATLTPNRVFRTDELTLARTAAEWGTDLSLGGLLGTGRGRSLLDTAPLHELVSGVLDVEALHRNLGTGHVRGLAVTATSYRSGLGVTFFEGAEAIAPWKRVTRIGVRAQIGTEHVLASSAIPLFFPAVCIDDTWYADGCIRLSTPLSPAIHMGARRVVAIAVRHGATERAVASTEIAPPYPSTADTAGILLDALFLDALEADVERATRINETLRFVPPGARAAGGPSLERVDVLVLRPSVDPAALVLATLGEFPATVRHLFRGLGASETGGWDLLSYLAFEGLYTTRLLELGYEDTRARADEIRAFLA